jgi:hypothetical protein
MSMKNSLWITIVVLVIVVVAFFAASWPALSFAKLEIGDLPARLAGLLLFALLIERTVEVFLTIWRGEGSYKKQAEVQHLISKSSKASDDALKTSQKELIEYKAETLRLALPFSFTLGLVIASFGVRVIEQFMDFSSSSAFSSMGYAQIRWFRVADILLTAALLAGGADPIHKIMDAFRKFMEASASKASGTSK